MVRYRPGYYDGTKELADSHYWKLRDWGFPTWESDSSHSDLASLTGRLRSRHIAHEATDTLDELRLLCTRPDRGLPRYHEYTLKDLYRSCQSRGIAVTEQTRSDPNALRIKLQQADEDATFDRLLDLPPELRLRVYQWYKASLNFGEFSAAPPITAVNHVIRKEALSVFFDERIFLIHSEDRLRCARFGEPMHGNELELQMVTDIFFSKAAEAILRAVRKLHIMSPICEVGGSASGYAEFMVDLSAKKRENRAVFENMGTFWALPWSTERAKAEVKAKEIEESLRKFADGVVARDSAAFCRADAAAILQIFKTSSL